MAVRPLLLFVLALFFASVLSGADDNALGIGSSGWELVLTHPPRECAQMQLWFNITKLDEPDEANVEFLTPDSAEDVWMVLRPTMGVGILSWRVPLHAGKQFVVRNHHGYEQVITVGSPTGDTACGQDASEVTSSSQYGNINTAVFNRLRSTNYGAYSVDSGGFRSMNFPSSGATVTQVNLGPVIQSSHVITTDPPSGGGGDDGGSSDPPGGTTTNPGTTTRSSDPTTTKGGAQTTTGGRSGTSAPPTSLSQSSGHDPKETDNSSSTGSDHSQTDGSTGVTDPSGNSSSSSSGTNIGAIIGGLVAALFLGLLIGAFCVWLHRRRRNQALEKQRIISMREANPLPPPLDESVSSVGATHGPASMLHYGFAAAGTAVLSSGDRKNAALFNRLSSEPSSSNRASTAFLSSSSAAPLSPVIDSGRRLYFGGASDFPDSTDAAESDAGTDSVLVVGPSNLPPPSYSRFADR